MTWQGQRTVVTGAGGFIGSHLVEELVREGANVTAFIRYNSRGDAGNLRYADPELRRAVTHYYGELRDPQAVRTAMEGADAVFHLGALIGIPYSYAHPHDVVQTNVLGTLNVLSAARELGTPRVVHTSTSEVYGTALYAPIDEKHPLQGQSPYSASKIGADKLAESYHLSYGLPVVTVRPFNTYGPRQSARAVIPTVIAQMLTRDRIRLGALTPLRDFNYVGDTVAGFLAAASSDRTIGEVVNLGSGREVSIGEVVDLIRELVGRDVTVETDEERLRPPGSEVERLLADNRKAGELMGWQPRVPLEKGLGETISWIREHLDLFQVERYAV
jgi:dTDP-glucose 4,6-dehydratase